MLCASRSMLLACGLLLSACNTFPYGTTFPGSRDDATVTIKDVKNSIECELAAVANDPELNFDASKNPNNFLHWDFVTDLDLTLLRSRGVDSKVTVTAPYTIAQVSATPSLGISGTDSSTAHLQFTTDIKTARARYRNICGGDDPSETKLGLAIWLKSVLTTVDPAVTKGLTYTKSFEVIANANARFGYTLLPVNNTVGFDVGGGGTYDRTNRFSIAMAPKLHPSDPDPIPVYITSPLPLPVTNVPTAQTTPPPPPRPAPIRARRAPGIANPTIYYLLQRKSPVKISQ